MQTFSFQAHWIDIHNRTDPRESGRHLPLLDLQALLAKLEREIPGAVERWQLLQQLFENIRTET